MSKITREASKNRFKKGMYPTEQDFANLHDSFVHKDDTIDPSKIVSGNENIVDIINRKAEESHAHAIADVDGLEDALSQVYAILGKASGETIAELASKFASLTSGYSDVYTFVETVKNFLEETDASNETINRWNEIEDFLQGITDSETLTGLLENLKSEIMGEVENLLNDKADRSELDYKADKSDLDNLQSSVSSLESTVNDKADRSDLDYKADKSDLDNLQSSVSSLESTVNDKADRSDLDYKADKSDLDNLQSSVSSLESTVNDKADTSTVNGIDERVSALENAEPVEQKEYTAGDGINISEEGVISLKPDENKLDCVKVIADLDASTAPTGTVAIYTGATKWKYIHGFVYEKTGATWTPLYVMNVVN